MQGGTSDAATPPPQQKESATTAQPDNKATSVNRDDPLPYVLARHKSDDCYFDVRLTQVELTYYQGQRVVHQLSFRLDLARPFEDGKRIRAAQLTINVRNQRDSGPDTAPEILAITPEASLIYIADHEVTTGQSVGITAGAPPATGASFAANANLSWGDKTSFKGNRLVHGYIPSRTQAQWKMYEESRSQSGLPPVLNFLIVLRAPEDFVVTADLHIRRWTGWGFIGMRKQIPAEPVRKGYLVRKEVLDDPGQKNLQISDDLLKLLDESYEKREVLDKLIWRHFPEIAKAYEVLEEKGGRRTISKKSAEILGEAQKAIESMFDLWRQMAETQDQLDALSMLYSTAIKMLATASEKREKRIEQLRRLQQKEEPEGSEPTEGITRLKMREELGADEDIDWKLAKIRHKEKLKSEEERKFLMDRPERPTYDDPANSRPGEMYESRGNRAVFGTKSPTAEEALAKHQAVSSAWAERKL